MGTLRFGDGRRLFENVGELELEQLRAIDAPDVTHIGYRTVAGPAVRTLEAEPDHDGDTGGEHSDRDQRDGEQQPDQHRDRDDESGGAGEALRSTPPTA